MSYLKMVAYGGQLSSQSGKEGYFLYEQMTARQGQKQAVLKGTYRPNEYELEIHINGILQTYLEDYTEFDKHTVHFTEELDEGDKLLFTVRKGKSNTNLFEVYEAVEGQTEMTLINEYHPGRSTLMVFDNGQLLTMGIDYLETDEKTVTFTKPFNDKKHIITFREIV